MRCALCGLPLGPKTYSLAVVLLHKKEPPETLATTRTICDRCAHPEQTSELAATIRRIPSLLA